MTISEILLEIHKEEVEIDVYQYLSDWILKTRASARSESLICKASLRAISKLSKDKAIIALCDTAG